jgi:ribosome-associated toxin RatA of RatAB toxin-antitoxin module
MPLVQAETEIAASPDSVFDLAQSYELRLLWDPFLRQIELRRGNGIPARGDRVWVRAWTGLTMEVEYVNVNRPHAVAMRMIDGPWIFEMFAGSWLFDATASGATRVLFKYNFRTRPRAAGALFDPVIARIFRRDVRARLAGLKHGVEVDHLTERLDPAGQLRS